MQGTYYAQVYYGQGYPLTKLVLILSDTQVLSDAQTFEVTAGLADTLNIADTKGIPSLEAGWGAFYCGQKYLGAAVPFTYSIPYISWEWRTPLSDAMALADFLGTQWQAQLALSDNLAISDSILAKLFKSATAVTLPILSTKEIYPMISTGLRSDII